VKGQKSVVGDTRWAPNGYHYTKTPHGWQLTHRLVAEKQLGRKLAEDERTKFIDGDKKNYKDPDNILVYKVRKTTEARKAAQLRAKINELESKLENLESA
jgi:hypothetical protein